MEQEFRGFRPQAFEFFRELAHHNNKTWFDAHRADYEEHVTGAFRGLLAALEPSLLELNLHFETGGKTNRSFSRINRDIRFSKDKSPYKPNYYLYVFDRRRDRQTDARLYVGLAADCVTVGFAAYASWKRGERSTLEAVFRPRLRAHRPLFDRLLGAIVRAGCYETYWHREEQGDWAQHAGLPRQEEDWQTLQAWIVRRVFRPDARRVSMPAFAAEVEGIFQNLYPLYVFTSGTHPKWQAELARRDAARGGR